MNKFKTYSKQYGSFAGKKYCWFPCQNPQAYNPGFTVSLITGLVNALYSPMITPMSVTKANMMSVFVRFFVVTPLLIISHCVLL